MAIDFPNSPTTGQIHTVNGKSWAYSGTRWETAVASSTKVVRDSGVSTALVSGDKNNIVRFTGSSAQTLTVDNVLATGDSTSVFQDGAGAVNFSAGAGVTLLSPGAFATKTRYSKVDVHCLASGQYRLSGDVSTIPVVTGGILSSDATYYYRTFTSNGTLTVANVSLALDVLIVAGGGGGGGVAPTGGYHAGGGGGGAGGYKTLTNYSALDSYAITVGAGGSTAAYEPTAGGNSVAFGTTATGGGKGGTGGSSIIAGDGGSGGGGVRDLVTAGLGISGQGNNGGTANSGYTPAAGGGGANAVGQAPTASVSGNGGNGLQWLNGSYYAGGGAGGNGNSSSTTTAGTGGLGGGGNGTTFATATTGFAATVNTGGGGGGACAYSTAVGTYGGAGGSGIVIVRYLKTAVGG